MGCTNYMSYWVTKVYIYEHCANKKLIKSFVFIYNILHVFFYYLIYYY